MVLAAALDDEPFFVELQVSERVRIATELAAISGSKPVNDLLEDLLIDYLSRTGYLDQPVNLNKILEAC